MAIENIKLVLYFLEAIELLRDLSLPEWNFRNIVATKLISLLKQQKTYWKQRGKLDGLKKGMLEQNSSMPMPLSETEKTTIATLKDSQGNICQTHDHKAKIVWEAFKDRMGKSEYNHMVFNLSDILQQVDGLEHLEAPFSKEEIDSIVSELSNNKSPGLDGFTNEFLKGCWPSIAQDFYNLCEDFFEGQICLRSINSSFITLIPKKDGP